MLMMPGESGDAVIIWVSVTHTRWTKVCCLYTVCNSSPPWNKSRVREKEKQTNNVGSSTILRHTHCYFCKANCMRLCEEVVPGGTQTLVFQTLILFLSPADTKMSPFKHKHLTIPMCPSKMCKHTPNRTAPNNKNQVMITKQTLLLHSSYAQTCQPPQFGDLVIRHNFGTDYLMNSTLIVTTLGISGPLIRLKRDE